MSVFLSAWWSTFTALSIPSSTESTPTNVSLKNTTHTPSISTLQSFLPCFDSSLLLSSIFLSLSMFLSILSLFHKSLYFILLFTLSLHFTSLFQSFLPPLSPLLSGPLYQVSAIYISISLSALFLLSIALSALFSLLINEAFFVRSLKTHKRQSKFFL